METFFTILILTARVISISKLSVDFNKSGKKVENFWYSTGLSPSDPCSRENVKAELTSSDIRRNIALIGSIPNNVIKQVRIHWLLHLVDIDLSNRLDLSALDHLLDVLYNYNLSPGFELMGNPGGVFTDFNNTEEQLFLFKTINVLKYRYLKRYGTDFVENWNFETWNEPDHKDFCGIKFDLETFLTFFDISISALKSGRNKLKLGGPAGSCRHPHFIKFCFGLLEHVTNGVNSWDEGTPLTLDFLSFHKKGKLEFFSLCLEVLHYSNCLQLCTSETKIINSMTVEIEEYKKRTLLARFPLENSSFSNSFFIKKPIYNFFTLQSNIKGRWLIIDQDDEDENMSGLASYGSQDFQLNSYFSWSSALMFSTNDTDVSLQLCFTLPNEVKPQQTVSHRLQLTNKESFNSYKQWLHMGSPSQPSEEQLTALLESSNIEQSQVEPFTPCQELSLVGPTVLLVQLCTQNPHIVPEQPHSLRLDSWRTVNNLTSLLLSWAWPQHTACIASFRLQFSRYSPVSSFQPVYNQTIRELSTILLSPQPGWYRVYAEDVWGRYGPPSTSKLLPPL